MAGHRRGTGKPRRTAQRADWHHIRVRAAPTGREQLAAAFDRFRAAASRSADADAELHAMASHLDAEAQRLEGAAR
jgi:hypothetical protein